MRQLSIFIVTGIAALFFCTPATAAKIKHLGSVYADSAGLALKHPEGVACSDNAFIVLDTGNSQVVRFSISAQGLTPAATYPLPGTSPLLAELDSKGNLYLLDGKSRTISRLDQQGQLADKIEPKGLPAPKDFIPRSFAFDRTDNIYLLDIFSARVLVLDPDQNFIRQIPFPQGFGFFSDLAVSPQGAIYLLDSVAGAIYAAEADAKEFSPFAQGLKEYMNFPVSLALDSKGVFYLSDQYGSGLALVGKDGSFLGRKFGMGWEDGQFYYPAQICISAQDRLIIADRSNSRVQVFDILEE